MTITITANLYPENASKSNVFNVVGIFDTYKVIEYIIISNILYANALDDTMPNCSGVN